LRCLPSVSHAMRQRIGCNHNALSWTLRVPRFKEQKNRSSPRSFRVYSYIEGLCCMPTFWTFAPCSWCIF
jgi:hypothetical protein